MSNAEFVVIIPVVDPKFVANIKKLIKLLNHTLSNVIHQKEVSVHTLVVTNIPQNLLKAHKNITYLLLNKSGYFKNINTKPVIHRDKFLKYLIGVHYCKKHFNPRYIIPMDADDIFMNDCFSRVNKLPAPKAGYIIDRGYQMVTQLLESGPIHCLNVNHSLKFNKMCGSCKFYNPQYLYKTLGDLLDMARIRTGPIEKFYHIKNNFERVIRRTKNNRPLLRFLGNHILTDNMDFLSKIYPNYYPAIKLSCHSLNNSRYKRNAPIYLDGHTKPIRNEADKKRALEAVKKVLHYNRIHAI